ncbi:hypothetical protein FS842_001481 [Serendipita sp. 407]|nr:hypothetical protein FS842_001481 [Serendipita sp. 407]
MSSLIFRGITVELSAEDDHFLRDVLHLVSELKLNDRYMDKADLLSRESSPGVWDANEPLILPEIVVHFTLSVFAELGGEGLQLVASQELYGTDLCDRLREPVAILLDGHENYPSMILKAKITTAADIFRQALGGEQSNNQTGESRVQDSAPISGDQTGNFEGLLQLLSQVNPDNDGSFPSYGSDNFGNCEDINRRIEMEEKAVRSTPDSHPDKHLLLNNLGSSLIRRFERLGNLDDLNSAIARNQAAVNLTPDGHPDKPSLLNNLGSSLISRFEHLGNVDDAEASIVQFSAASLSPVGYPSVRLAAAREWIGAAITTNHTSLLTACECATTIIPLVAWLGLSILDRHQHLAQIGGIVRDVASIAISLGKCDKAIEWLEQGRSIVWTQILQLRTPVDELGAVEPDLAGRLLHVSSLLDQGMKSTKSHHEGEPSLEEEAQQYRALARERDEIIERIRSLPRFGDFLRPPKLHQLVNAAKEGPVVVLNVSNIRCDALALVYGADEVIHIPLPDLTSEKITQLQAEFNSILKSSGVRLRAVRDEEVEVGGDEGCKRILAELWDYLVKPVLDSLAFCIHFLVSGGV